MCIHDSFEILQVLDQAHSTNGFVGPITESFESRKQTILLLLFKFDEGPPFTLQRLAEVLLDPARYYRSTYKLMNSIEKLLSVDM